MEKKKIKVCIEILYLIKYMKAFKDFTKSGDEIIKRTN